MAPRIDTIAESSKFYTWHESTMYFGTSITAPLETAAPGEPNVGPIFFAVSSFLRAVQSVAAAQNAVELPEESQRPDENQASDDRGLRE